MVIWIALLAGCGFASTVALGPWIADVARSRRRAKRELQTLGPPLRSPKEHTGGAVTLAGKLEVCSEPIDAFDGGEAAATSAFDRDQAGSAAVKTAWAEVLALLTDDGERVEISGPVEVRAGSRERIARRELTRLASPIRSRILAAVAGRGLDPNRTGASISIRSIGANDRVRAKGQLAVDSSDASAPVCHEAAGRLRLVPVDDADAPRPLSIVIACEEAPRVRLGAREMGWRAAVGALLAACSVLYVVPWTLASHVEALESRARDGLSAGCDPVDLETAERADALRVEQSRFPGWSSSAERGRARLVSRMLGAMRQSSSEACPHDRTDELGEFAASRLPELIGSNQFSSLRMELERFWHESGRDRRIVEISRRLPEGGDVIERVRAHLYLGDLHGAADAWRQSGAFTAPRNIFLDKDVLTKGNVLCMAGDYSAALEAWAAQLDALEREEIVLRPALLVRHAECHRRAGDLERAERVVGELAAIPAGVADAAYLRALIAEDRGELDSALQALKVNGSDDFFRGASHQLLALSLLAQKGDHTALLKVFAEGRLAHVLSVLQHDAGLFSAIYQPILDEDRLEFVGDALARAPENAERIPATGSYFRGESAREVAGLFYLALAVRKSRRFDPRAEDDFDRAEALRPDDEDLRRARRAMAFFHGDWDAPSGSYEASSSPGVTFLDLRAAYLGERALEHDDQTLRTIVLAGLNPHDLEFEIGLAKRYSEGMSPEDLLGILEKQHLAVAWPTLFYRITNLIVHGEHMGFDMSERRAQLGTLREMFDAQPNSILLAGINGRDNI